MENAKIQIRISPVDAPSESFTCSRVVSVRSIFDCYSSFSDLLQSYEAAVLPTYGLVAPEPDAADAQPE